MSKKRNGTCQYGIDPAIVWRRLGATGNTIIHTLTSQGALYQLRVDLEDFEGNWVFALYDSFVLESEDNYFQLVLGQYSGDAGDSLSHHSGKNFSTYDRDLDSYDGNCASSYKGGWWYGACHSSNLNGLYLAGNHTSYANGVDWSAWRGYHYSAKTSVMKIGRKVNFVP
ncbi:techylectin-5A-like [Gigantopelta aegis]|uniref:techylectin-5A-like n=1 Tax=Gigantopelta aegis TaxID=1735272 RepID=UPI001B887F6D|nr:techylectin-5A-like [Gigantopelta aegis]